MKDIIQKKAPHLALNVQKDNHQIKIHHLVFYVPQVHFRIIIMLNVPPVLQDIIIQKKEHPNVVNVLLGHFLKKLGLLLALVVHLVLMSTDSITEVMRLINNDQVVVAPVQTGKIHAATKPNSSSVGQRFAMPAIANSAQHEMAQA